MATHSRGDPYVRLDDVIDFVRRHADAAEELARLRAAYSTEIAREPGVGQ